MKKQIITWVVVITTVLAVIGLIALDVHTHNKAWVNAQRYAQEHDCKCYSTKQSSVYVFSDYSLIGYGAMADYYKD